MKIKPLNLRPDIFYIGFKFIANEINCIIVKIDRTNNILKYHHPDYNHHGNYYAEIEIDRASSWVESGFWKKII